MSQLPVFSDYKSIYKTQFNDSKIIVLSFDKVSSNDKGIIDITDYIQSAIYELKRRDGYGIVMIPEGIYSINKTIYIPRAIRLIGFGEKRPLIILKKDTPGYQVEPADDKGKANYMFWFTSDIPDANGKIEDANPGTFYSAISNIDFKIEDGNPAAVVIRSHFAQNCFVSYCSFNIGNGKAGIFDIGNEMNNLTFIGGNYGIYTTKCSPGWPFVLIDSCFQGQRKSGIFSRETGLTIVRTEFSNMPTSIEVEDDYWGKLFMKNCIVKDINDTAIKLSRENNSCTQVNAENIYCDSVPNFILMKETNKKISCQYDSYKINVFSYGDKIILGQKIPTRDTIFEYERNNGFTLDIYKDIPDIEHQNLWKSVKDYGAEGDGVCDDTLAIQKTINENKYVYFPQGFYRISNTIFLKDDSVLLGFNPISTQIILKDNTPAFAGLGSPKAMIETCELGNNIINGIGIDTASRNPRAVACKWMSGKDSYMNDIKFVGGHGRISNSEEFMPCYNKSHTADYDEDSPWDSQYWSLWITKNGGGTFKDIWSASPYAESGIYISDTKTPGTMYQVSVEHHVRTEIIIKNVENWCFYGIQTEEEKAEGSYCQPYEIVDSKNLTFANFYVFRVIWVDNPYYCAVKMWNCQNICFMNVHNFTQMKYTINNVLYDVNSNKTVAFWQLSKLYVDKDDSKKELPSKKGDLIKLAENLDNIDSMCKDSKGNIYM